MNSFLQIYFNLTSFRETIAKYKPPTMSNQNQHNIYSINLVKEIQLLLIKTLVSQRKFLSPEKVLLNVTDDKGKPVSIGSQKDAGEFNINLISKIDMGIRANQLKTSTSSLHTSSILSQDNAIRDMFSGKFEVTIQQKGKLISTNEQTFGQIQIFPISNIYASWISTYYMQKLQNLRIANEIINDACQTFSITTLPRVLFFQVERVNYNAQSKKTHKNTQKLKVDKIIYADLMAKANSEASKSIESILLLQKKHAALKENINKWNAFHSKNGTPFEHIVNFLDSQKIESENVDEKEATPSYLMLEELALFAKVTDKLPAAKEFFKKISEVAAERESKLKLQKKEIKQQIHELLYKPGKIPYYLHSILIHSGTPDSGHYYAYIYDFAGNKWWKYNDSYVKEEKEEVVMAEAIGGYDLTSAYYLVYISEEEKKMKMGDVFCSLSEPVKPLYYSHLSQDAIKTIERDNAVLKQNAEMKKYDDCMKMIEESYFAKFTLLEEYKMKEKYKPMLHAINYIFFLYTISPIYSKYELLNNAFSDIYNDFTIDTLNPKDIAFSKLNDLIHTNELAFPPSLSQSFYHVPANTKKQFADNISFYVICTYALEHIISFNYKKGIEAIIYSFQKYKVNSDNAKADIASHIVAPFLLSLCDKIENLITLANETDATEIFEIAKAIYRCNECIKVHYTTAVSRGVIDTAKEIIKYSKKAGAQVTTYCQNAEVLLEFGDNAIKQTELYPKIAVVRM